MSLLNTIFDKAGLSGYAADKKLAKKSAGVVFSREEYEKYKKSVGSLCARFKSEKQIDRDFYGYGTPSEQSAYGVTNAILAHLKKGGVVLDLTKEENKVALNNLTRAISSFASNKGFVPTPVEPYNEVGAFKRVATEWQNLLNRQ